jgi:hypothetical protein
VRTAFLRTARLAVLSRQEMRVYDTALQHLCQEVFYNSLLLQPTEHDPSKFGLPLPECNNIRWFLNLFPCSGFHGEISNSATAERVIARLNHCKAIETVYLKPPEEMA